MTNSEISYVRRSGYCITPSSLLRIAERSAAYNFAHRHDNELQHEYARHSLTMLRRLRERIA